MQQQISVITLGIADIARSKRFYVDGFGWTPVFENPEIVFYQMNGLMLGTWLSAALEGVGSSSGRPVSFGSWIIVDAATRVRASRLARDAATCVFARAARGAKLAGAVFCDSRGALQRSALGHRHYKKAAFREAARAVFLLKAQRESGAGDGNRTHGSSLGS